MKVQKIYDPDGTAFVHFPLPVAPATYSLDAIRFLRFSGEGQPAQMGLRDAKTLLAGWRDIVHDPVMGCQCYRIPCRQVTLS